MLHAVARQIGAAAGSFPDRDKRRRRDKSAKSDVSSAKRLEPGQFAVGQPDDWLIVWLDFNALQRFVDIALYPQLSRGGVDGAGSS